MKNRVTVITLGVADVARARAFYEAMGWSGESPDGDVVFFQAGGMVLALWGRDKLAEDSAVEDAGGWGGVTLAYNVGSPGEVDVVLDEARAAGATIGRPGRSHVLGRVLGDLHRPRRPSLGGGPQPRLDPGGRRQRAPARLNCGTSDSTDGESRRRVQTAALAGVTGRPAGRRGRRLNGDSPTGFSGRIGSHDTAQLRPEPLAA